MVTIYRDISVLVCVLLITVTTAAPYRVSNTETREKRNSEKITDLRSKLSKLQDLLQKIENEDVISNEKMVADVGRNATRRDNEAVKATESVMGNSGKSVIPDKRSDEEEVLKALQIALQKEKEKRIQQDLQRLKSEPEQTDNEDTFYEKTLQQKKSKSKKSMLLDELLQELGSQQKPIKDTGTFYEKPLEQKKSKSKESMLLDKLLQRLEGQQKPIKDELKSYVQPKEGRFGSFKQEDEFKSYVQPKEGHFGGIVQNDKLRKYILQNKEKFKRFRQEVLHALEQRLLEDVDTAMSNGFSLEEILRDLSRADEDENILEMEAIEKKLLELLHAEK